MCIFLLKTHQSETSLLVTTYIIVHQSNSSLRNGDSKVIFLQTSIANADVFFFFLAKHTYQPHISSGDDDNGMYITYGQVRAISYLRKVDAPLVMSCFFLDEHRESSSLVTKLQLDVTSYSWLDRMFRLRQGLKKCYSASKCLLGQILVSLLKSYGTLP